MTNLYAILAELLQNLCTLYLFFTTFKYFSRQLFRGKCIHSFDREKCTCKSELVIIVQYRAVRNRTVRPQASALGKRIKRKGKSKRLEEQL